MSNLTDGWTAQDQGQIEQVFGLTGGELMDVPWTLGNQTFPFWYHEPPEYAQSDFDWTAHEFRTVVTNIMFRDPMFAKPPEHIDGWHRVAIFRSSGETECPGRHEDTTLVRADQCVDSDECFYCEEKIGQEHSYIYLGDGWAEVVYRKEES